MENGITWKNPYVLGGAGLLLVVLVASRMGGGGGSAGYGLQSQAIATGANVQLAGIGAGLDAKALETASLVDLSRDSNRTAMFGASLAFLSHRDDNDLQRFAVGKTVDAAITTNRDNLAAFTAADIRADATRRYTIDAEKIVVPQLAQISATSSENLLRIQGANELAIKQQDANTIGAIQMRQRSMQTDQQSSDFTSQLLGLGGSLLGRVVGTGSGGGLLGLFGL